MPVKFKATIDKNNVRENISLLFTLPIFWHNQVLDDTIWLLSPYDSYLEYHH